MADIESEGGFLARWSQRKQADRRGEALAPDPPSDPIEEPRLPTGQMEDPVQETQAPRILTDDDMPALESLDAHSDYSGFLSQGVSRALRRKALSKFFHSPHLNQTDGLDDYAEDFTRFDGLGDVITSDMRHQMEVAAQRLLAQQERSAEGPSLDGARDCAESVEPEDVPATRSAGVSEDLPEPPEETDPSPDPLLVKGDPP